LEGYFRSFLEPNNERSYPDHKCDVDKRGHVRNLAEFTGQREMAGDASGGICFKGSAIVKRAGQEERKEENIAVMMRGMGDTIMGQLEVEISEREEEKNTQWCEIHLQQPDIKMAVENERVRLGITEGAGLILLG